MSVVVAICQDGVVYMGADTATTKDAGRRSYALGPLAKIMRMEDNVLVGSTGSAVVKQLLMGHPELLRWGDEGLDRRWFSTEFIPHFREVCQEMGWATDGVLDNDLFVAQGGKLLTFISDTIARVSDCVAMGSGACYALSALKDESLSIEDRILEALRAAAEFDEAVDKPFVLINTQDMTYKEVAE